MLRRARLVRPAQRGGCSALKALCIAIAQVSPSWETSRGVCDWCGGTSALSAALSAIKFVCRRRRGCNTYASLRSEETFMTTHNRNHGPRACREHAKRIALIMQQKLATSAAHASHTRNTGAPRRRQNRRLRAARLRRAATCFFSAPHVPASHTSMRAPRGDDGRNPSGCETSHVPRTGTIIMPSLKAAVLALALAPAGAAKTAEETDASGLCGNQRALRNRHRHAIEQAPRRWRGCRRGDSARTRRKFLISTQARGRARGGEK